MFTIQSVVVPKEKYNLDKAEELVNKLGHNTLYRNKRVTGYLAGQTKNFWRFRQLPPSRFDEDTFRMKKLDNGVFLVVGKLKNK